MIKRLENQINHIQRETHPVVTGRPCRGDPRPVKVAKQVWVNRTLQGSITLTSTSGQITSGELYDALGFNTDVKIDWMKFWNVTGRMIQVAVDPAILITGAEVASETWRDYAPFSSFPGVEINVPSVLAKVIAPVTGGTDKVAAITTANSGETVMFQIGVLMRMV